MTGLTPAELARRAESQTGIRLDAKVALSFLRTWARQGITEEAEDGWRLTPAGLAMFSGWAVSEARSGT